MNIVQRLVFAAGVSLVALGAAQAQTNLITNGTFTDGLNGWVPRTGEEANFTVINGALLITNPDGGISVLSKPLQTIAGKQYSLTMDVYQASASGGTFLVSIPGAFANFGTSPSSGAPITQTILVNTVSPDPLGNKDQFYFNTSGSNAGAAFLVDNVVLCEVGTPQCPTAASTTQSNAFSAETISQANAAVVAQQGPDPDPNPVVEEPPPQPTIPLVQLNLRGGLSANQVIVQAALARTIAIGDADPNLKGQALGLATFLNGLSDAQYGRLLQEAASEVHAGLGGLGFRATGAFLQVMTMPSARVRQGSVMAYAPAASFDAPSLAGVMAADLAAAPAALPAETVRGPRAGAWAAVLGSTGTSDGSATIGSSKRTDESVGLAAGADVVVLPGLTAGVALAAGRASSSVANGLGKIEADVFQVGAYAQGRFGPLGISAAIGYAQFDTESERVVDGLALRADYKAHAWSGRVEALYDLGRWAGFGFAPVAAVQVASVRSPSFVERDADRDPVTTVAAATRVTARTELGLQVETSGPGLTAFARAAWGHYVERDAAVTLSLLNFAPSAFTVTGAQTDRNVALLSAGVDWAITPTVSLGARVDGELSENSRNVSGMARVRINF